MFSKLVKHVSPDALAEYVAQLQAEVRKYVAHDPRNYGKAAKRMYNVFRLTGRYAEAWPDYEARLLSAVPRLPRVDAPRGPRRTQGEQETEQAERELLHG